MIYSVHESDNKILTSLIKETSSLRTNYYQTSSGNRIADSFFLITVDFTFIEICGGNLRYIGNAVLSYKSKNEADSCEEYADLKYLTAVETGSPDNNYGSILFSDITSYCRDKNFKYINSSAFSDTGECMKLILR